MLTPMLSPMLRKMNVVALPTCLTCLVTIATASAQTTGSTTGTASAQTTGSITGTVSAQTTGPTTGTVSAQTTGSTTGSTTTGSTSSRKVLKRVEPVYPPLARQARLTGRVKLVLIVTPEGKVQGVNVIGGHPVLVEAAEIAARQWKFQPASKETNQVVAFDFVP